MINFCEGVHQELEGDFDRRKLGLDGVAQKNYQ